MAVSKARRYTSRSQCDLIFTFIFGPLVPLSPCPQVYCPFNDSVPAWRHRRSITASSHLASPMNSTTCTASAAISHGHGMSGCTISRGNGGVGKSSCRSAVHAERHRDQAGGEGHGATQRPHRIIEAGKEVNRLLEEVDDVPRLAAPEQKGRREPHAEAVQGQQRHAP